VVNSSVGLLGREKSNPLLYIEGRQTRNAAHFEALLEKGREIQTISAKEGLALVFVLNR